MPRIAYQRFKFQKATLQIIEQANEIIDEYAEQGFSLTLRQLYYQFVARDLIPNNMKSYKRLGSIINDARLAGMIDWDAIEDRTRNLQSWSHHASPADALQETLDRYREDLWRTQPYHIEAWIEKDALIGVLEDACGRYRLPHFSCRGYVSQSEMWGAPQRWRKHAEAGKKIVVLHLGDHDPSGVDMSRDIEARLNGFSNVSFKSGTWTPFEVEVVRLALNMDQVRLYKPPPNPAKITDSRAHDYIAKYGRKSWELDALDPRTIRGLIHDAVKARLDVAAWNAARKAEEESKKVLSGLIDQLEDENDD